MINNSKLTTLVAVLAVGATVVFAALGQSRSPASAVQPLRARWLPLELGKKIPLSVQSRPVTWKGNTYHLLSLGAIQFELEPKEGRLRAEIQAGTTSFDDVTYDVSAAVFDTRANLLGTARAECKVERVWLGNVLTSAHTLTLDFGSSLDYASATTFTVSINHRKVLTPAEWQKNK